MKKNNNLFYSEDEFKTLKLEVDKLKKEIIKKNILIENLYLELVRKDEEFAKKNI